VKEGRVPKSLHGWLHYSALKWMMPGEAVQEDHGGMWHKLSDSAWTECGRWVAGANRRAGAGFGPSRFSLRSPWWGRGSLPVANLCPKCFAVELPILAELESAVVHGGPPMGDSEGESK